MYPRHTLIADLLNAPERIQAIEASLIRAAQAHQNAKDEVRDLEADLLQQTNADGKPFPIDGKNEAIRSAQLREHTLPLALAVRETEVTLSAARASLAYEQNRFAALRTVAGLLGPEVTL